MRARLNVGSQGMDFLLHLGDEVTDELGCALWLLMPDLPSSAPWACIALYWILNVRWSAQRCLTGLPKA